MNYHEELIKKLEQRRDDIRSIPALKAGAE